MRRRFIADTWTPDRTTATLTGDQAHHLAHVLRAQPGQIYDIVADGFLHRAEIVSVADTAVLFHLKEELEAAAALPLHLLLAVFKFDHLEWAIEKATELGVARITPILARRTEKHLAQAAAKRVERWRRIALEAAKQSRRTDLPDIADPIPLKQALDTETATTRLLLSETEQATTLTQALSSFVAGRGPMPPLSSFAKGGRPASVLAVACSSPPATNIVIPSEAAIAGAAVASPLSSSALPDKEGGETACLALAIGPEGGWTPEEMALFTAHNWHPVTLGPRILRAETAAIAAIAITGAHLLSLDSPGTLK